ncbi:hypothetical protein [Gimesia fumaroli]|uniref:Uncharacterized protein n=1 Tax=Gimesia fumaroli TaxID=2527976 RepID=A0A518IF86_9PLAN|nr:hypothetical protein [Gimesia fumaroli]QDV51762.1 hypothetical protein Enr17x_38200 [Gimesia fumaroli]
MYEIKTLTSSAIVTMFSGLILLTGSNSPAKGGECDQHGLAAYAAIQDGDSVTVFANGVHRTSGFKNCLELGPEDVFPPIFDFKIKRPTGDVIQLITLFTVHANFTADQAVKKVTVRDANGIHRVEVVQILQEKQSPGDSNKTGKRKRLDSTYQTVPLDFGTEVGNGFRFISLIGTLADEKMIDLSLDPNTCSLNKFGDRTGCTEIANTHLKVKLQRLRLADPLKLGREIYRIQSKEFPKSLIVYLIVPKSDSGYRIILQKPDSTVVVALEESSTVNKGK